MVPSQAVAACGADLAMVIDLRLRCEGARIMLWDNSARILGIRGSKVRIEGAGTLGQHG